MTDDAAGIRGAMNRIEKLCDCGRLIEPPDPERQITAPGGWCAPAETVYDDFSWTSPMCAGCSARFLMIMMLGIDPGRDGENLRVRRGGIQYPRSDDDNDTDTADTAD